MRLIGLRDDQADGAALAARLDRLFSACLPRPPSGSGSVRRSRGLQRGPLAGR
ncbi:hypothetical protein D9M69_381070 [compost metagenome]